MTDLDKTQLIKLIRKHVEWSNEAKTTETQAYHAGCAAIYALMCDENINKYGLHYYGDCEYVKYNHQQSLEVF